jgi:succinyl-CoA synthetase beta subunit
LFPVLLHIQCAELKATTKKERTMNFEEYAAKPLLREVGIETPEGRLASTAEQAAEIVQALGPCVIKAQVPVGKRGHAGGIKLADDAGAAAEVAKDILGMDIAGHRVNLVLVEQQVSIAQEFYAAVLTNATSKGPMILFSTQGGMDIEEVAANTPEKLLHLEIDVNQGVKIDGVLDMLLPADLGDIELELAEVLCRLYEVFTRYDAELVEINPLVVTQDHRLVALDCKFSMDDSAAARQAETAQAASPEKLTLLEARGLELGLKYIELEGDIGIIANGAGLTMTTMDVVSFYDGKPANFLEIGGDAYTKAKPALELVLSNPSVKVLVVNFCGAFARCDVMMQGIIDAWLELKPDIPVFFSIHGTGDVEAVALLKERMNKDPCEDMDSACKAAVEAAAL